MQTTNTQTRTRTTRLRRRAVAAALAAGLVLPGTAAYASGAAEDTRNVAHHDKHPVVDIDRVYRGTLEGALGAHTWTGDLFGTGTDTTVTYTVVLDADGVPIVSSVVVDESTLPQGTTYEVRSGSVDTRTTSDRDHQSGDDASKDASNEADGQGDTKQEDETDASGSIVNASVTSTATSGDSESEGAEDPDGSETAEDPESDGADDAVTKTFFAGRAGVRFTMGDRWAGLLILVHGVLGTESAAAIRTIMVSPPSVGLERPVATDEPDDDTADDEDRKSDKDRDDRSKRRVDWRDRDDDRDDGDRRWGRDHNNRGDDNDGGWSDSGHDGGSDRGRGRGHH